MLTKEQVKKIKWYRQSGAGIPFTIGMPFWAMVPFYQKTGWYFPNDLATFLKTDAGFIWYHYFDYFLTLELIEKIFDKVARNINFFKELETEFFQAGERTEKTGLELVKLPVTSEKFNDTYNTFLQGTLDFWADSLFIDLLDPFENKIIDFIFGERKPLKEQINRLFSPDDLSQLQKEQKELLGIYQKAGGKISDEIKDDLRKHSQKFYWLKTDYEKVEFLDEKYYLKELEKLINKPRQVSDIEKSLNKFEEDQKEKKKLIADLNLDQETIKRLNFFNWVTNYRDERKKYNQISNYVFLEMLRKISQELGIDSKDLKYAMPDEIPAIVKKDEGVLDELAKRKGEGVIVFADLKNKIEVCSGKIAREYFDIVEQTIQSSEIKGTTASAGKAIGEARIILSQADFGKMRKGDVLVASMTRPEYAPIMKKAAAIVTDEGGITCHAAIVSRELGIPCIVGTQVATRALKDGDLIDVNANHGLIKIIKKAGNE